MNWPIRNHYQIISTLDYQEQHQIYIYISSFPFFFYFFYCWCKNEMGCTDQLAAFTRLKAHQNTRKQGRAKELTQWIRRDFFTSIFDVLVPERTWTSPLESPPFTPSSEFPFIRVSISSLSPPPSSPFSASGLGIGDTLKSFRTSFLSSSLYLQSINNNMAFML